MSSGLREAVLGGGKGAVEKALAAMGTGRLLADAVEELLPFSLMQANLRYGSFHAVKMQLFLRRLALDGFFSPPTELALARLVSLEMASAEFIPVRADVPPRRHSPDGPPEGRMLEEVRRGNVHNAFYHASCAAARDPAGLLHALLLNGAASVSSTLGHSLTCFYPAAEDVVLRGRPEAPTALLSHLMYLCRFRTGPAGARRGGEGRAVNHDALLTRCASGDGIVNLHHMITFSIMSAWESSPFAAGRRAVPWGILSRWIAGKEPDRSRQARVGDDGFAGTLPGSYDDFARAFSLRELDTSMPLLFRLIEERRREAADWLFRFYASRYRGDWDPHYFTGLCCALRLNHGREGVSAVARRMALDQAVRYFAQGIA